MKKPISVLIADDNIELAGIIRTKFELEGGMIVKGIARDGLTAIQMINDLEPEIVILDIVMPNLDGIGVLERIREARPAQRPIIIVITAVGQDTFVRKAMELGADYFIMKPFDINILISRMKQLYDEKSNNMNALLDEEQKGHTCTTHGDNILPVDRIITNMISNVGITPNIIGFHYLREAIKLSIDNPAALNSVSKRIYPVIADKYNTTVRNVDRAIRCAIKGASRKSGFNEIQECMIDEHSCINMLSNTNVIYFFAKKVAIETGLSDRFDNLSAAIRPGKVSSVLRKTVF